MPKQPPKKVKNLGFPPSDEYGHVSPYRAKVKGAVRENERNIFPAPNHSPEEYPVPLANGGARRQQANDLHNALLIDAALKMQDARRRAAGGIPLSDEMGYISPYRQSLLNAEQVPVHPGNLFPNDREMERRMAVERSMRLREALARQATRGRR